MNTERVEAAAKALRELEGEKQTPWEELDYRIKTVWIGRALAAITAADAASGERVQQVTHATLDAKSLYEISVCANALDGLTRLSGPDANTRTTETAAYWSKKLRALVDNHMRCGAEVAVELYGPAKNSSCGK